MSCHEKLDVDTSAVKTNGVSVYDLYVFTTEDRQTIESFSDQCSAHGDWCLSQILHFFFFSSFFLLFFFLSSFFYLSSSFFFFLFLLLLLLLPLFLFIPLLPKTNKTHAELIKPMIVVDVDYKLSFPYIVIK